MARRIDDAALLVWATIAAYQATWKPSTAELRYGWIDRGADRRPSRSGTREPRR